MTKWKLILFEKDREVNTSQIAAKLADRAKLTINESTVNKLGRALKKNPTYISLLQKIYTFGTMLKRLAITILFFIACVINLGHSFFPHSHIVEHHHHGGKHHHHHKENSIENGLSLLFSHFNHTSDTFSNSHIEDVVKLIKEVPNQVFVIHSTSVFTDSIGYYNKKEEVRNKEPLIFISPHLHSLQFRGPPTLIS